VAAAVPTAWQPVAALEGAVGVAAAAKAVGVAAVVGAEAEAAEAAAAEVGVASGNQRQEQSASVAQCFGVASLVAGAAPQPPPQARPKHPPSRRRSSRPLAVQRIISTVVWRSPRTISGTLRSGTTATAVRTIC